MQSYHEGALGMESILNTRMSANRDEYKPALRLSNMGTPCTRKLWYNINEPHGGETLSASTKLKFLYGDIIEQLLISLAVAAGHKVEGLQDTLEAHGIKGHRDCVIDGITVDVKSASSYSFDKFRQGGLRDNDPFGYISQLSSYVYAGRTHEVESHPTLGAFLVMDKQHGHICLDMYDLNYEISQKEEQFEATKAAMASEEVPPRGFEDEPEGKSGNRKLGTYCGYCDRKAKCWPDLRTFLYGRGPVFLTEVQREPRETVKEVT